MLIGWSCSAPHDNPLDPASPNYTAPPDSVIPDPVPTFSTRLRSVHTARTTNDTYRVSVELWPDSAMSLDTVFCQYRDNTPIGLRLTPATGRWTASLSSGYFGSDSLEAVLGQPFNFIVQYADTEWTCGPKYVFRVIDESPVPLDPDSSEVVGSFPTLSWQPFGAEYPIRYQIIVEHRLEFSIETLWTSDTLLSSARQIQVTDSLPDDNDFHWILFVYDEFGNSSSSLETSFQVVAEEDSL